MGKLLERLDAAPVLCAEGYLFELERRGYLQAGAFVPEVVLDHPEAVAQLHRDFLHAGSDVVLAFTYYAHRDKMRIIGKEDLVEPLQKEALKIAKEIAAEADGALFAGDISNTNIYNPGDKETHKQARQMFEEQTQWAVDAGVDFIVVETISWHGEAMLALEVTKQSGLDIVVNVVTHSTGLLREEMTPADSCKALADAGAAVVGMNCCRGPATMMPQLLEVRAAVSGHVAGVPVAYRTDDSHPSFQSLEDRHPQACIPKDMRAFPVALDALVCTRYEMAAFAKQCADNNINLIGICCGGAPHHLRAMAEALGRTPPGSKYSPDMSKHYALGKEGVARDENRAFVQNL